MFSSYVTAELLHLKLICLSGACAASDFFFFFTLVKNGGLLILPTAFYTSKEEIIADLPRLVLQAGRQPISASAAPLLV